MPVYEYSCEACGPFEALRPLAQCRDDHPCPVCAGPATRAFLSAPALGVVSAATRQAHAVNERSANEPRSTAAGGHRHGPGCGCGSGTRASGVTSPSGNKAFPDRRPWMISH